jgi:hypothetical protein
MVAVLLILTGSVLMIMSGLLVMYGVLAVAAGEGSGGHGGGWQLLVFGIPLLVCGILAARKGLRIQNELQK